MLAGPGPGGVVSREIVHMTDLFPTFLAAAEGAPDPSWRVDGANLLSVWTGTGAGPDRTLFWEWRSEGANQLAALRGNLKLVVTNGGKPELFDVVVDPAERRDLSAAQAGSLPSAPARAESLAGNGGPAVIFS